MLFWITLIALLFSIMILLISAEKDWDTMNYIGIFLTVLASVLLAVMIFVMAIMHLGNDGYVASMRQRYDALVYQAENHLYDDDIHVSKKELADQITDWNEDLAKNKTNQKDLWIGIFVPDIYDEFEFIDISMIGK